MSFNFYNSPDILFWIISILSIIILIWVGSILKNEKWYRVLIFLRSLTILILLFLLLQPVFTLKQVRTRQLPWAVYLDNSASMRYHNTPSLSEINSELTGIYDFLENENQTYKTFLFADSIIESAKRGILNARGVSTDLGNVIKHYSANKTDLAGAFILTDGQLTQGSDPLQNMDKLLHPIYILGVGNETPMVDVAIKSIDVPTVVIKGDLVNVKVDVVTTGPVKDRLNVALYKQNKLLGSRFIRAQGGGSQTEVHFQFKPEQIGKSGYRVQVSSLSAEINIKNNQQNFTVLVLKDLYRVALVTGVPNNNTPVIKRFLRQQTRLKIDHFVQLSKQRMRPSLKSFWETSYELIIFDAYPQQVLSRNFQRLFGKKLLAGNSAFCLIAGPGQTFENTKELYPFLKIDNIESELKNEELSWSFTPAANTLGYNSELIPESDYPPLVPALAVKATVDNAQIIAEFQTKNYLPLVILQENKSLRSMIWTSADMSSVHFRTTGTGRADLLSEFWTKSLDWLLRTGGANELFFRFSKSNYQQGELIKISGTSPYDQKYKFAQKEVFIKVYKDGKKVLNNEITFNLARKRWETNLRASTPGIYTYEIFITAGNTSKILQKGSYQVEESQIELNQVFLNGSLLKEISNQSSGKFKPWENRQEILELLKQKEKHELWTDVFKFNEQYGLLIIIFMLLSLEWILRRLKGLA